MKPVEFSSMSLSRFITHMHGDHCYGLPVSSARLSACALDTLMQGFICSLPLHWQPPAAAAAAGGAAAVAAAEFDADEDGQDAEVQDFSSSQKKIELVGPQHLATFLRTTFTCSDVHFPWNFHVTELLSAASPIPHIDPASLHANEAPPTFVLPQPDGTYAVPARLAGGVTVRAAPLTHRVFCLGYALTEPDRPGK
jgi:ribonuclease BN (tRNA processing enzyme)